MSLVIHFLRNPPLSLRDSYKHEKMQRTAQNWLKNVDERVIGLDLFHGFKLSLIQ